MITGDWEGFEPAANSFIESGGVFGDRDIEQFCRVWYPEIRIIFGTEDQSKKKKRHFPFVIVIYCFLLYFSSFASSNIFFVTKFLLLDSSWLDIMKFHLFLSVGGLLIASKNRFRNTQNWQLIVFRGSAFDGTVIWPSLMSKLKNEKGGEGYKKNQDIRTRIKICTMWCGR